MVYNRKVVNQLTIKHIRKGISTVLAVVIGISIGGVASAAPPHIVSYNGTPVKTAVAGEKVKINYKVTNTSDDTYSGVKVIFHIPEGITHTSVSPANSSIVDDIITWENVPIAAGESFKLSLTLNIDSGTALKTKKNIWVEVTGDGMENTSQNFSLTSVAKVSSNSTSVSTINAGSIFQLVYGRAASASELTYWKGRTSDKPNRGQLTGAMQFHKLLKIPH